MLYKIFYIFYSDDTPFDIEIDETRTVIDLQKVIKTDHPERATGKLELYLIDATSITEANDKDLNRLKSLAVFHRLSTVFGPTGPLKDKLHILVNRSAGQLMNSRVYGAVVETVLLQIQHQERQVTPTIPAPESSESPVSQTHGRISD